MKQIVSMVWLAAALSLSALPQKKAASQPWVSVPLPQTPLAITAHDGSFWVSGMNGLIARSSDQGRTWQVVHRQRSGADLTQIAFPAPHTITVAGSDAVWLESRDDGNHWSGDKRRAGPFLTDAVFTAVNTEFGAMGNRLLWTADGGQHWQWRQFSSHAQSPLTILALAAQGGTDVAALAQGGSRPPSLPAQFVLATSDAGASWHTVALPAGTVWRQLRGGKRGFFLYGTSDQGEPQTSSSADGQHWSTPVLAPAVYSLCHRQGCLVSGGWADLQAATPQLWNLPADQAQPLTNSWAAVGTTVCRVSTTLRCHTGAQAWRNSEPVLVRAGQITIRVRSWDSLADRDTLQAFDTTNLSGPSNVVRQMPTAPVARGDRVSGCAEVRVLIGPSGRVQQALLLAATSASLGAPALQRSRKLRFRPVKVDGHPRPAELDVLFYGQ